MHLSTNFRMHLSTNFRKHLSTNFRKLAVRVTGNCMVVKIEMVTSMYRKTLSTSKLYIRSVKCHVDCFWSTVSINPWNGNDGNGRIACVSRNHGCGTMPIWTISQQNGTLKLLCP